MPSMHASIGGQMAPFVRLHSACLVLLLCLQPLYMVAKPQLSSPGIEFRNPRVYNLKYSFRFSPDQELINKETDLKIWIPIPREWESQKAIDITKVSPCSKSTYIDPEHGNRILYWDLGTEPIQDTYTIDIEYRLESNEIHADVDPEKVGEYDVTANEFRLYTRSSRTIQITPKIRQLAQEATGNETNPFLKSKRIYDFVKFRMRYRFHELEIGRDTDSFLTNQEIDRNIGIQYFEGSQDQHTMLYVAMCRAAGIPTRSVQGTIGFDPRVKEDDLKPMSEIKISPEGMAGAQHDGCKLWNGPVIRPITWAECFIPNYGWIPIDLYHDFGHLDNWRIILSKGTDILIGPTASEATSEGYGTQWVTLDEGRVDLLREPVWNISKIQEARIKSFHLSDPFPADAYAQYADYRWSSENRKVLWTKTRRKKHLSALHNAIFRKESFNLENHHAYYCHLFRQIVGEKNFIEIFNKYHELRAATKAPVQKEEFQALAEELHGSPLAGFFNQWMDTTTVIGLKLDSVSVEEGLNNWTVSGLIIEGGSATFKLPVEIAIQTENGTTTDTIWCDSRVTRFEAQVPRKPVKIIADPNYHIPCDRKMPVKLYEFWHYYPDMVIVYGTSEESGANKNTAEQFNNDNLGLESSQIIPDTNVTREDLMNDVVVFVGRPETNQVTKRYESAFPVKFKESGFYWQGLIYQDPSQGILQMIENPVNPLGRIILFSGNSGEATIEINNLRTNIPELFGGSYRWSKDPFSVYDANASYVIFEDRNVLTYGEWEIEDDLVWISK